MPVGTSALSELASVSSMSRVNTSNKVGYDQESLVNHIWIYSRPKELEQKTFRGIRLFYKKFAIVYTSALHNLPA